MDLKDLVASMVKDVRSGKAKRQAKKKRTQEKAENPKPTFPKNPWLEESIILLIHRHSCSCGKGHEFPNEHLLIKRKRIVRDKEELYYDKLEGNPEAVYGHLPRRIEYNTSHVTHCEACFDATETPEPPATPTYRPQTSKTPMIMLPFPVSDFVVMA